MDVWVLSTGEGTLTAPGIVVYESIGDSIGVGGNAGLADATELPDDIISGLMMSCESYEPGCAGAFKYAELSDPTSPQSQNMASSEEFQGDRASCGANDLGSVKYA
jgi:hypothetical protein